MATHLYATDTARIGKFKGEILKRAMGMEVLGITGQHKEIPQNNSQTVEYKRWLPYGGVDNVWIADGGDTAFVAAHLLQEGVTPTPDSMSSTTVTAIIQEYAALYGYTNRVSETYEDDVPAEMVKQVTERLVLVREMVRWGELKSCTNVFYGGTGTSIVTVDGIVTGNKLRAVKRSLERNHAKIVTEILAASPNFNTMPVEAAFLVFMHTDCESDVRDLQGFVPVAEYGSRKVVHSRELGTWENFRFITSPELTYNAAGGVVVGSAPGLKADDSTNIDVYPMVITGEDAWGDVALRGVNSLDASHIPPSKKDKSDMLGQRGYAGTRFWCDCTILNAGWMAVLWVGVTDI